MSQNRNLVIAGLMLMLLAGIWGVISPDPQSVAGAAPDPTDPTLTPTATPTMTATSPDEGITDSDVVVTPADLPLQPVGTPFTDPIFGTTLRRASDASENGSFGTHIYSQLQAFSADSAYALFFENDNYIVRRVDDLSRVEGLDTSGWNVPRWQPAQPHTIVHYDSDADTTLRVRYTHVDTLDTTTVFTFPSRYDRIENNQSFDELSEDGRWMAGMASLSNGDQAIFALDLEDLELAAQFTISELYAGPCEPDPEWGEVGPDWIGVSPLGNYLVVQWQRDGTSRCSGLETFDLQSGEFVGRVYDGHQHGDLGVLPDDETEFFMTFELYHPSGNLSLGVRELPGNATVSEPAYVQVLDWGNGAHISCQGPPGVCLVTAGTWDGNGWSNFEGELFLQYTDGRVRRLAHHRSSSCGYWVQPRASLSRDGRYVVFASDWKHGTGSDSCGASDLGRGDPYVIDLGAAAPEIPTACSPDADENGVVNVVDIETRASEASCQAYLPLIASYWREAWPAAGQP